MARGEEIGWNGWYGANGCNGWNGELNPNAGDCGYGVNCGDIVPYGLYGKDGP